MKFTRPEDTQTRPPDERRCVIGVDLGQAVDSTAVVIAEQERFDAEGGRQATRLLVRHVERLPLGTGYPAVVERLAQIKFNQRPEVEAFLRRAPMLMDATGLGRPVVEMAKERGLNVVPVVFTGGDRATFDDQSRSWRVPKATLVSSVQTFLQRGRLRLPGGFPETLTLVDELKTFSLRVSAAGNLSFEAEAGRHDDVVMALAMVCWWSLEKPLPTWTKESFVHIPRRSIFGRRKPVWRTRSTPTNREKRWT